MAEPKIATKCHRQPSELLKIPATSNRHKHEKVLFGCWENDFRPLLTAGLRDNHMISNETGHKAHVFFPIHVLHSPSADGTHYVYAFCVSSLWKQLRDTTVAHQGH